MHPDGKKSARELESANARAMVELAGMKYLLSWKAASAYFTASKEGKGGEHNVSRS
jgi:hypothetical protein